MLTPISVTCKRQLQSAEWKALVAVVLLSSPS